MPAQVIINLLHNLIKILGSAKVFKGVLIFRRELVAIDIAFIQ